MRALLLLSAALAGSIALAIGSAHAQQARSGSLDPSFGRNGKVTTSFGSKLSAQANALALQRDGKIVAVGTRSTPEFTSPQFALARYNANGSLDRSFGTGGKVTVDSGNWAYAAMVQPNGRIVVAGGYGDGGNFALARFDTDGSLDASFGTGGWVMTHFGSGTGTGVGALARQPDGKVVAAGGASNGTDTDFALARYNANGSLDTSFGTGGKVTTAISPGSDAASALALQPDGKLIVAGSDSSRDFALARYNPNGSLDTSFGTGGKVTTPIGSGDDQARDIALQADGKLVAVGYSSDEGGAFTMDFALVRYAADGSLDTSFGGTGKVRTNLGPAYDDAFALVLQPDSKLVAAGYSDTGSEGDFALARYKANGSLDTSFGTDGKVTTSLYPGSGVAFALARQPDGKLVAAGYSSYTSRGDFALVQYLSGRERCVVPNVTRKTSAQAKLAATRAYCSLGRITRSYSDTVEKGRVISQRPSAGAKRPVGAKVSLVVSKGARGA